jgi:TRAP-type mannitol/chloroaromatic compound transport system substrate-binding protein
MNAQGMRAWLQGGGGQELWDELYAPHGVFSIPAGSTGIQMGGWFRKPIKSSKDFKGLKMRIPGLGGKVISKLGGKPILVAGGEIFTNLSTGVIDATEWVGPYHDYIMGFYKAAKFYYYPGWHEPGPLLELMVNKKAYNQLPAEFKSVLQAATAKMDRDIPINWVAKDSEYLQKIMNEKKAKVLPFPDEVITKLKKTSMEVLDEVQKSGPLAKKIYKSYMDFKSTYDNYLNVTDRPYLKATET